LTILNRTPDSAQAIAERVFQALRVKVKTGELTTQNIRSNLSADAIVVNTTSLGMSPHLTQSPVPAGMLNKGLVVFDIVYNPLKTCLLIEAEKRGARIISGLEMLVRQGAAAFELWTGVEAPVDIMRTTAEETLRKNE
jgi:shikimate dehydrogenase